MCITFYLIHMHVGEFLGLLAAPQKSIYRSIFKAKVIFQALLISKNRFLKKNTFKCSDIFSHV